MLAKFSGLNSKGPNRSLKKEKKTFCVSFTNSVRRARENRKCHVVVELGLLKNVHAKKRGASAKLLFY